MSDMTERCETCRAPVVREGARVQFDSSRYHMDAVKRLSEISALRSEIERLEAALREIRQAAEDNNLHPDYIIALTALDKGQT